MRQTPVIVFINKLDRPSKEPFDLLDEVEKELHIRVRPLAFPISNGPIVPGRSTTFTRRTSRSSRRTKTHRRRLDREISDLASPELEELHRRKFAAQLRSGRGLVEGVYDQFDREAYLRANWPRCSSARRSTTSACANCSECFVPHRPLAAPGAHRNPAAWSLRSRK